MKSLKVIVVISFVMAILKLGVSPVWAIDEDSKLFRAYGVGPKKCALYIQLRERKLPGKYSAKD